MELPVLIDPQPLVEEVISSDEEVETQSEEIEEETQEESTESLIHYKDFKVFYHQGEIEDIASNSRLAKTLVSEDQEATEVPEVIVLEKRMPDLLSLLEYHAGGATPEVPIVPKPPTPVPPPPLQTEPVDKKRQRDEKRGRSSMEEGEIQEETLPEQTKATKTSRHQQRRGGETSEMIPECRSHVPNWNPPLVLDGAPLPTDSSIRNFDNGRAGYVANLVELALLLPWDMAKLRNLKKHEMFLSLKRDLALATQAAHVAEEWVDQALYEKKEEESKCYATQKAQAQADKKLKETLLKLSECDKARKSTDASVESFERQAREQLHHLKEAESQLNIARARISELTKELEQKNEEMNKVKQAAYDLG